MDITRVKATIQQGELAAKHGSDLTLSAQGRAEEARNQAAAVAHDSTHREVAAGMARIKEAVRESSQVAELLAAGAEAARRYVSRI